MVLAEQSRTKFFIETVLLYLVPFSYHSFKNIYELPSQNVERDEYKDVLSESLEPLNKFVLGHEIFYCTDK